MRGKEGIEMKQSRLTDLILGLAVLLSVVQLAQAKGPWSKVTISGQGLSAIDITDPQLLDDLSLDKFLDWNVKMIQPLQISGGGYDMVRGWDGNNGTFINFDELHYY